jgi:sec-independent protein translocase protein TatA
MWEILLIFLMVLLLFGAKRLPEIGSSLGKGIREFKSSIRDIEKEIKMPEERKGLHSPPASGPGSRSAMSESLSREEEAQPRRLSTDNG